MITFDNLPVVLVSAANETVAASVITELVDNDVTEEYIKAALSPDRVWRLVNKYYKADVRVHPYVDGAAPDFNPEIVEAHIIHISADEIVEGVGVAERRAAASLDAWRDSDVRVLLLESAAGVWATWGAWAAAARAELVPRNELAPADVPAPEPFADAYGIQRARNALHAHPWPNLVRTDMSHQQIMFFGEDPLMLGASDDEFDPAGLVGEVGGYSSASSTDDPDWFPDEELDEQFAVEHAEAFAAALNALGEEPRGDDVPDDVPREARLDRAEELVIAFWRALGQQLDNA